MARKKNGLGSAWQAAPLRETPPVRRPCSAKARGSVADRKPWTLSQASQGSGVEQANQQASSAQSENSQLLAAVVAMQGQRAELAHTRDMADQLAVLKAADTDTDSPATLVADPLPKHLDAARNRR